VKFLMVASRPRSGTHWIKTAIGSCPGVHAIPEEPFHDQYRGEAGFWDERWGPQEWLERKAGAVDWCVFCTHPGHLPSHEALLPACQRFVTAVMILYRRDLLANFVSNELAYLNWEWSTEAGEPPTHGTLEVDRDKFREWCAFCRESLETDKRLWSDLPTITVAYEDVVADETGVLGQVGALTGIDVSNAKPLTAKKERRQLSEVVTNYQEARAWAAELAIP
jgi:LPS sulfotransferase NodH